MTNFVSNQFNPPMINSEFNTVPIIVVIHHYWLLFSALNHAHLISFDFINCLIILVFVMNNMEILTEIIESPQIDVAISKIITKRGKGTLLNIY